MAAKSQQDIERRLIEDDAQVVRCECEKTGRPKYTIRGYAARYYKQNAPVESKDLGGFVERIMPGAFDEAIKRGTDIVALYNHDPMFILGRESSGTLRVFLDEDGLRYEIDAPESRQDVVEAILRGDVRGSSFAFRVSGPGEQWSRDTEGRQVRSIVSVDGIFDVGPVLKPAYPASDSFVSQRALDIARSEVAPSGNPSMPDPEEVEEQDEAEHTETETRAVSMKPTAGMAAAAKIGLRLHKEGLSGDGLKPETVARANKLARREEMNRDWIVEMNAWFKRHYPSSKSDGWDKAPKYSPFYVAFQLWGGYAAMKFSARKVKEIESSDDRSEGDKSQSTPAPKEDQIKGSSKNPKGSAKNAGGRIKVSMTVRKALENKVREHNAKMKKAGKPKWSRATVRQLLAVYRRGAGAYSTSHRPGVSRAAWSMARVNAYLRILSTGSPEDSKYKTDNDLLPSGHPKSTRAAPESVETRSEQRDEGTDSGTLSANNYDTYEAMSRIAKENGRWPQQGPDGCQYSPKSQWAARGIKCGNCIFYNEGGVCDIVSGEVAGEGLCRFWQIPEEKISATEGNKTAASQAAKMKAASLMGATGVRK